MRWLSLGVRVRVRVILLGLGLAGLWAPVVNCPLAAGVCGRPDDDDDEAGHDDDDDGRNTS